ncbi:MAG: hypothetical protein ABIO72_02210 [Patescibacteria group bacterium]
MFLRIERLMAKLGVASELTHDLDEKEDDLVATAQEKILGACCWSMGRSVQDGLQGCEFFIGATYDEGVSFRYDHLKEHWEMSVDSPEEHKKRAEKIQKKSGASASDTAYTRVLADLECPTTQLSDDEAFAKIQELVTQCILSKRPSS